MKPWFKGRLQRFHNAHKGLVYFWLQKGFTQNNKLTAFAVDSCGQRTVAQFTGKNHWVQLTINDCFAILEVGTDAEELLDRFSLEFYDQEGSMIACHMSTPKAEGDHEGKSFDIMVSLHELSKLMDKAHFFTIEDMSLCLTRFQRYISSSPAEWQLPLPEDDNEERMIEYLKKYRRIPPRRRS